MSLPEVKSYKEFYFRLLVPFKGETIHNNNPYWAETCFGLFMETVYLPSREGFEWIWFTRYQMPLSVDKFIKPAIKGKKYFSKVESGKRYYQCIFIRSSVEVTTMPTLKKNVKLFAKKYGYIATDFSVAEPGFYVADLGGHRFSPPVSSMTDAMNIEFKKVRAKWVLNYLYSACVMYFWSLRKYSGGVYASERNDASQNRTTGSTLESYHHMFCNMTNVPLYVFRKGRDVCTSIYPCPTWKPKEKGIKRIRIQF